MTGVTETADDGGIELPDIWNRRDDTVGQRVGKWAFRQFVLLPVLIVLIAGVWALISALHH